MSATMPRGFGTPARAVQIGMEAGRLRVGDEPRRHARHEAGHDEGGAVPPKPETR